jgi:RNA polymerase sigma-70 factor, ECF subfamily
MTGLTTTGGASLALREAAAGDEDAFVRIVDAYQRDMVRVAYGICGEQDLAGDAVQAALLIAWRKLHTVRDPEHLRSWLVAVTANEARHLVRRRRRGRIVELDLDAPDAESTDSQAAIRRLDLVNALRRLSPDERALVALRYGADLDSAAIGRQLGISASGTRSRLLRVMGRLRKELEDA